MCPETGENTGDDIGPNGRTVSFLHPKESGFPLDSGSAKAPTASPGWPYAIDDSFLAKNGKVFFDCSGGNLELTCDIAG